jgi:hypothetical protein
MVIVTVKVPMCIVIRIKAPPPFGDVDRPCLKNAKTPKRRIFFRHTALISLAIRQYSCGKSPCLTKKSLAAEHSGIYQARPTAANLRSA